MKFCTRTLADSVCAVSGGASMLRPEIAREAITFGAEFSATARAHRHRSVIVALGVLMALCPCAFALDPYLDVSQYAHTAWRIRERLHYRLCADTRRVSLVGHGIRVAAL